MSVLLKCIMSYWSTQFNSKLHDNSCTYRVKKTVTPIQCLCLVHASCLLEQTIARMEKRLEQVLGKSSQRLQPIVAATAAPAPKKGSP